MEVWQVPPTTSPMRPFPTRFRKGGLQPARSCSNMTQYKVDVLMRILANQLSLR
ncbi:hypothetical protein BDR22DRAFT_862578 [Usnea florida]